MSIVPPTNSTNNWSILSIVTTMFPILLILSILEMGSGYILETLETTYLENPTLLVLVPVMIGMGGNLGSIFSSRLSTRLHLGTLTFDTRDPILWTNIIAILALAATIFTLLGITTHLIGRLLLSPMPISDLLIITLTSGMLLAIIAIILSFTATYISYQHGLDPDDTTIPVVTNLCDILGVVILSGTATLLL